MSSSVSSSQFCRFSFSQWVELYMKGEIEEVPMAIPLDERDRKQSEASDNDKTSVNGEEPRINREKTSAHNNESGTKLKWGIVGAGRVCHDFVQALKYVPDSEVIAIGASSLDKATKFSHQHNISNAYGSYAEVCMDSNVDIIYIGTLHPWHLDHALLAINNNKHLLVEKPVTCNGKDTQYLLEEAQKRNLFFLEGLWTRFFPAVETSRKIIEEGIIGDIVAVHADFGFNASDSEPYPTSPFYNIDSGGGGLLFLGPYPLVAATMAFPGEMPDSIKAIGTKDTSTGVDLSAGIVMEYKNKAIAVLTYNITGETPEETIYIGTKGRLRIKTPAHCPTSFELTFKLPGRGQVVEREFHYPLEKDKEEVLKTGGFNYPNSQGFRYEAEAVTRCILQGGKFCPQFLPSESLIMANIMDEIRTQLGVQECKRPQSVNNYTSVSSTDGVTKSNP